MGIAAETLASKPDVHLLDVLTRAHAFVRLHSSVEYQYARRPGSALSSSSTAISTIAAPFAAAAVFAAACDVTAVFAASCPAASRLYQSGRHRRHPSHNAFGRVRARP